ncbi:MAG: hypothetical protein ACI35S_06370 [Anaeroplasma sp.]
MQSREFISRGKAFFRDLRKGNEKFKTEIKTEIGISFPVMDKILPKLLSDGPLKETTKKKLMINPNYQLFAGVYISKDSIDISVLNFSGEETRFETKKFCLQISFFETLREILNLNSSTKALSICSDEYFDYMGIAKINEYILLDNHIMKDFVPEGIEYYFEKTCVTNSFKWYEDAEDDELNVIFSFFEDNSYYTIMKNGVIVQKRRYSNSLKEVNYFYENVIFPVWQAINPNNMIFIAPSENIFNFLKDNISIWSEKIRRAGIIVNQCFEVRRPTNLIVQEQFHPSESAALYAMYKYYGWAE